jgi:DNA-binding IclR family transcriptional regulator
VGERAMMHYTSVGKAMMAYLTEPEVSEILQTHGLPSGTKNSITDVKILQEELRQIRSDGYSIDNAEHEANTYCLGAPIFDENSRVIAACSISGKDKEILGKNKDRYSAVLRYSAQSISRQMGFIPKGETFIWKDISNPLLDR